HAARVTAGPERDALRETASAHLAAQVPDAALRARLTPDYEIGCKRVLLSDDYYPALASGRVRLEASAIVAIDPDGVGAVGASGRRHEADVLVFATGFAAARPPFAERIRGRGGELLADHWAEGMTAYASMLVAGFPNLMVLDGPNAALGHNSAFAMIEAQAELAAVLVARLGAPSAAAPAGAEVATPAPGLTVGTDLIETTPAAEAAWTARIDAAARDTVWLQGGCRSWYVDERSNRLTLLWPGTATEFRAALESVAAEQIPPAHAPATGAAFRRAVTPASGAALADTHAP
ncbi:MAG: hypothetical protein Q7T71_07710, partial [Herbiconiux sp.]|nr:hypothetical protein [Herbiconiux sp.]